MGTDRRGIRMLRNYAKEKWFTDIQKKAYLEHIFLAG